MNEMKKLEQNDFMRYAFLSSPRFAPGGKRAAFAVSRANEKENGYDSFLYLLEGDAVRQLTSIGRERAFYWEDEDTILFPAVRTKAEQDRAQSGEPFTSFYRLSLNGGEALPAFTVDFAVSSLKVMGGGRYLLTGSIRKDRPDLYQADVETKKKALEEDKQNKDYEVLTETPFWFNGAGYIDGNRTALFLYDANDGKCVRITEPLFSTDQAEYEDGIVYYTGVVHEGPTKLYNQFFSYDPATGVTETLYGGEDFSIERFVKLGKKFFLFATKGERYGLNENPMGYLFDPSERDLELVWENEDSIGNSTGSDCRLGGGQSVVRAGDEIHFITTRGGNAVLHSVDAAGTERVLFDAEGSVDSFDECEGDIIAVGMYENRLQEIYRIRNGKCEKVSSFNDAVLEGVYKAEYHPLSVESEGTRIDGWVLLPEDFDPSGSYPAVFDIHGGPKTVYGPVFYHEMQYWVNEGWIVFFCNPTGSDGRGNEFADIRGKYGTVDFRNLMDFCDGVLEAYPQIDRSRVAVTGGSYGGFMSNWIMGHTDRFACIGTQRSISNWISFSGNSDIGPYFGSDQMAAGLDNVEKLWFHSPLAYVANAKTPTLFIHSDEDYRCPLSEGMQLFTALVQKGVPARMCVFHGENHELSRGGKPLHRARRLKELTDWFTKYTK